MCNVVVVTPFERLFEIGRTSRLLAGPRHNIIQMNIRKYFGISTVVTKNCNQPICATNEYAPLPLGLSVVTQHRGKLTQKDSRECFLLHLH
jgi:hypothetical protein